MGKKRLAVTMLPFEVNCPKCGARLVVSDQDWIDHPVSCPDCGEIFTAEEPTDSELVQEEPEDAVPIGPPPIHSDLNLPEMKHPETHFTESIRSEPLPQETLIPSENIPPIIDSGDLGKDAVLSENFSLNESGEFSEGKTAEESEPEEEMETPFYFQTFFFAALGTIALLLLGIILLLVREGDHAAPPFKTDPSAVSEKTDPESETETNPPESAEEGASSPLNDSETSSVDEENSLDVEEDVIEEDVIEEGVIDEGVIDLTQIPETEFFKPSDLSLSESTSETDSESPATDSPLPDESDSPDENDLPGESGATSSDSEDQIGPLPSSESVAADSAAVSERGESGDSLSDEEPVSPSSETNEDDPKNDVEKPEAVPNGDALTSSASEKKDQEPDFETFSGREPDSLTGTIPNIKGAEAINIPKRLSLSVKRIHLTEKSLPEIIRIISEFSGIPISLDVDSLPFPVETLETRVNIDMGQFTVGAILQKVAEIYGLESETLPDAIRLTVPKKEKETVVKSRFDVADIVEGTFGSVPFSETGFPTADDDQRFNEETSSILPGPLTVDWLSVFLKDFLETDLAESSSSSEKGEPTETAEPLKIEGNAILLSSNLKTAEEADSLLERIRNIRHIPPKSDKMAEDLIPETLGWENLSNIASLQFLKPVPLREALILLETTKGIRFLVDLSEMKTVGASLDSPVKIAASDVTVDQILTELLGRLDLTYVILTEDLLWITSKEKAARKMTTEIHFFASSGEPVSRESLENLIHQIKTEVEPTSWRKGEKESDDSDRELGILRADPLSGSFLIRQSQPTQRAIRRFLMKKSGQETGPLSKGGSSAADSPILGSPTLPSTLPENE